MITASFRLVISGFNFPGEGGRLNRIMHKVVTEVTAAHKNSWFRVSYIAIILNNYQKHVSSPPLPEQQCSHFHFKSPVSLSCCLCSFGFATDNVNSWGREVLTRNSGCWSGAKWNKLFSFRRKKHLVSENCENSDFWEDISTNGVGKTNLCPKTEKKLVALTQLCCQLDRI